MKKLLAVVLTVVLVLSFSVSAFALKSPGGTVYHEVIVNRTNDGASSETAERIVVKENGELELKPVENDQRDFEGWKFFKPNMEAAVEGKDFEIVAVTKKDGSKAVEGTDYEIKNGQVIPKDGAYINVTIKPLADTVYVSEVYKGVKIEFKVPDGTVNSPVTGASLSVVAILFAAVIGGAALMLASRKAVKA
ncbi:MAG: hypothetical protein E7568_01795 [Ruminococcaceae bacterium]|nr:hypothetical protein [Oscillospiraceae bacterium]